MCERERESERERERVCVCIHTLTPRLSDMQDGVLFSGPVARGDGNLCDVSAKPSTAPKMLLS